MKKLGFVFIGLILFLFYSCDEGEFTPLDLDIELTFPKNEEPCEKGINIPNQNGIEIQLEWKVIGEIDSFELYIDDIKEDNFSPQFNNETKVYFFKRVFPYRSSEYKWKIVDASTGSNIESPIFSFTTPATASNNNTAPYPVIFDENVQFTPITSGKRMTVAWQTQDLDATDNVSLRFDAYLNTDSSVSPQNYIGEPKLQLSENEVSFEIANFSSNQEYFVLIIARDNSGNESYSRASFCELCN